MAYTSVSKYTWLELDHDEIAKIIKGEMDSALQNLPLMNPSVEQPALLDNSLGKYNHRMLMEDLSLKKSTPTHHYH